MRGEWPSVGKGGLAHRLHHGTDIGLQGGKGGGTMQKRPILVIDDDSRSCQTVTAILTDAGFKVLAASDGPSGIKKARAAQPAVIIVDMLMPGVDGIGTCELLKRDLVLSDIPVIGVTGTGDLKYTQKAFRAGAQFFLTKPFGRASLVQLVKLALESARQETPKNRRDRPRFPATVPVRCLVGGDANITREIVGHTEHVSLDDLLLLLPEKLAPGTACRLRLDLPTGSVTAEGAVASQDSEPMGDGKIRHGIQLLRFAKDADLVQYRRFLSQITAGRAE